MTLLFPASLCAHVVGIDPFVSTSSDTSPGGGGGGVRKRKRKGRGGGESFNHSGGELGCSPLLQGRQGRINSLL